MRVALLAALASAVAAARPNFVYVLLDDMNTVLGDEAIVTHTRKLIADQGARASNAFVSSPKCTPSRSAWLTGRHYHNCRPHGKTSGRGLNTSNHFDVDALFPILHRNGYQTGLFGKIHNDQGGWLCSEKNHTEPFTHIETECHPCGNYNPQDFVVKRKDERYTRMETLQPDDPRTHYSHAQYGNRSAAWIREVAPQGPFFCFVGTTGPHLPAAPAPWHKDMVDKLNISAPRTPNFNGCHHQKQCKDHNHLLATHELLDDGVVAHIDLLMRQRWAVLLSIDDLVAGLVEALQDSGVMDNTYFLFSSDHGYHLGQHRIPIEKMLPYETDIRVPFFIRGPGIKPGTKLSEMIANVDIAPTLLDLAGLPVPKVMDGLSMKRLLTGEQSEPWRTRFISEFAEGTTQTYGGWAPLYDEPQNQWRMLRVINETHDIAYIEWDQDYVFDKVDFHEYYDLKTDPWQQVNIWQSTDAATQAALHEELVGLYVCRGTQGKEFSSCHTAAVQPMPTPDPMPPSLTSGFKELVVV
jgi:N-acetylglucosamine-6-sulfatase